jgi:phenylacetate-coenzyme A ligase PaaK-like adenylate-forming protein
MLDSAISQLRYGFGMLRGRIRAEPLTRISRDLVQTLAEFGAPGEDAAQLPGQSRGTTDTGLLLEQRARGLRATARAAAHTAYYRQLFAERGIRPDELTPENWAELIPVTPKRALRGLPAAFVSDLAEPVLMAMTTGTTGGPTTVWYSAEELELLGALGTISYSLAEGMRPHDVLAYAGSSRASLTLLVTAQLAQRIGAGFVPLGALDPALALEHLAAPLGLPGKSAQISRLICAPSYLAALVGLAETEGWQPEDFGLERIQVGGEILTKALRSRAAAAFGAEITSGYMSTEVMPAGAGYCTEGHLHFPPELGHAEFLRPDSWEPADPGQEAIIVITPYAAYRRCTVLLRYATGDLVRVPEGPLDCELAGLPACSDILGRYSGPLSSAVPTRSVLELLEAEPAVPLPARYVLVDRPDGPLLHVAADRGASQALREGLEKRALDLGLELGGVILHEDAAELPAAPVPLRSDLRERSFDPVPPRRTGPDPEPARSTALNGTRS